MTILGTRPEIIKMSRVITLFDEHTKHILVHTGQNYDYELNEQFFREMGVRKPDYFLDAAGKNAAETIGNVIIKADEVLEKEKPDALLIYGDTNSGLAVIAAKRRRIPIFHMEAGNRCFDQRVPEELNRKVIDHLSDINMVLSEHARRYLISEGIRPETIMKIGSNLGEVLSYYMPKIQKSDVLARLSLKPKQYFIVSMHREENVDDPLVLNDFLTTLNGLAQKYRWPVIVSTHPRTRKKIEALGSIVLDPLITFSPPFGFFDYIKLQMESYCVISDSGTISEESSILGLSSIMIRNAHERPESIDSGTAFMTGLKLQQVLDAIGIVTQDKNQKVREAVADYDTQIASVKILKIVLGYIQYVNRTVWFKSPSLEG
jgi:UDP-N-acetylglucosamine 2-epimerase (non-hydrolysing)